MLTRFRRVTPHARRRAFALASGQDFCPLVSGRRGGISVARTLSMPVDPAKPTIMAATYAVVLFSIIVQGGPLGWVVRRTVRATEAG